MEDPGGGFAGGGGGAFGGGKAGATQDPLLFLKKPPVVARLTALIFAIIVFGCISSQGWTYSNSANKDICIMNNSASACHFSTFVGVIGFLASVGFLVGEWFFEQFSSIKTRKHYVIADMAFSGLWAFFYFIAFIYMCVSWSKTETRFDYGSSTIIGAIFFAFCSIFSWAGGAFFAYQRFQAGSDAAFSQGIGEEEMGGGGDDDYAAGYAAAAANESGYNEPPFGGGNQGGMNYGQPVQY